MSSLHAFFLHSMPNYVTALAYYECLVTLSQEVATIWSRKFNFPALLYAATRLISLWNVTDGVAQDFDSHIGVGHTYTSPWINLRTLL